MNDSSARNLLARCHWLYQVPTDIRDTLLAACRFRRLESGRWVWGVDDDSGGPVGIVSGALIVEVPRASDNHCVEWLLQPGHWIGLASVVTGQPRKVSLRVQSATQIAYLPARSIARICADRPETWRWLALQTVIGNDQLIRIAASMTEPDSRKRVAQILLLLSRSAFVGGPPRVPIPLTHEALAAHCGLTRSGLTRHLAHFEAIGALQLAYRELEILDPSLLEAAS